MPIFLQNGNNMASSSKSTGNLSGTFQKPSLTKIAAVDVENDETKKLSRGISRTAENAGVISEICKKVCASLAEVDETISPNGSHSHVLETNDCTFSLPDLSNQSDEFRAFLESELIDTSMLISLQEAARLNWWTCLGEGCERLWPLSTTGDGNCLLHAASLGMWGFHDRLLILRKALHTFLTMGAHRHALWRRWRWQNARANLQTGLDLTLDEEEWKKEWDSILKLSSSQPRTSGSSTPCAGDTEVDGVPFNGGSKTYESLEEIHVLALAHVLKRPIFVIADTVLKDVNGEALAPIPFGGIYLPLEIEPSECSRSPLVLAYDAAHFSALVAMNKLRLTQMAENETPAVIPLVDVDRELLPIQFEVDPGEGCIWNRDESNEATVKRVALNHEDRLALLNQFLDLVDIPCPSIIKHNQAKSQKGRQEVKSISNQYRSSHDTEGWNSDNEYGGFRSINTGGKAPGKQLQSVAKQFGSLGRSVGRRIKKNIMENFTVRHQQPSSSISRSSASQWECPEFILCARLHTEKHHPCLEQMITNYLQSARQRFEQQQEERQKQTLVWQRKKQHTLAEVAVQEGPSPCINPDCTMFGTALTSYMCTACYTKQLEHEEERAKTLKPTVSRSLSGNQHALYGTGKSVFYAQSDSQSHANATSIPARRPPSGQNGTLHLSNSTFYNDVGPSLVGQYSPKKEEKIFFEKISPNIVDKLKRCDGTVLVNAMSKTTDHTTHENEVQNGNLSPSDLSIKSRFECNRSTNPVIVTSKFESVNNAGEGSLDTSTNPRLLSHYDSIRKKCKSSGCTSYGAANTQWFCPECFYIRKKAALTRESILDDMKAAQMQ